MRRCSGEDVCGGSGLGCNGDFAGSCIAFYVRFISYAVAVVPSTQRNVVSICIFACQNAKVAAPVALKEHREGQKCPS